MWHCAGTGEEMLDRREDDSSDQEEEEMDWADNMDGLEILLYEDDALQGPASEPPAQLEPVFENENGIVIAPVDNGLHQQPLEGLAAGIVEEVEVPLPQARVIPGPDQVPEDVQLPVGQGSSASGGSGGGGSSIQAEHAYNTSARASRDMAKKREVQSGSLREKMDPEQLLAYEAILAEKRKRLTVRDLIGGRPVEVPDIGSMLSNGDHRLLAAQLNISLGQQQVTTYSFNTDTMQCLCKSEHNTLKMAATGGETRCGREAFLLTDQCFPAVLPADGKRKCLKIVRIEHGMLGELAAEFVNLLKGRYLAAGGVVLLFSATNLAAAGIAGYTADLMHSIERLKKEVGEHMVYAPLPHYFGAGCKDEQTVRGAVELSAWAADVFGGERCYLKHTFEVATDILVAAGTDGMQPAVHARHRLPTMDMRYRTWASSVQIGLPRATRPVGEKEEKDFVCSLISEIRSGMAIDLDPTPSFERGVAATIGGEEGEVVLVVGSKQAANMHAEMRRQGLAADLIELPLWRISKTEVDSLLLKIEQEKKDKKIAAVVFQLMDNTVFTAITEEGEKIQPVLRDNTLHWTGDLSVCDKPILAKLLKILKPVLEATVDFKTVMMGPLPRFVTGSCCEDPGHIPNRGQSGFLNNMVGELEELHKNVRDFLFVEGLRHVRIMNPWVGMRGTSPTNIWGEDPIMVLPAVLPKLVEGVKLTLSKITLKRRSDNATPEPKRSRSTTGQAEDPRAGHRNSGGGGDRGGRGGSREGGSSRSFQGTGYNRGSYGGYGGGGSGSSRHGGGGGNRGGRRGGGWGYRN
jgi:hypothetical protein